jgi:crotonobetainyl-CoA:carnitine CoA-transferase CaiB-like acyl-CoA transferase
MANEGPLAGLRVIEMAGWNGVLAGRLLADAGAEVIRVYDAVMGDPLDSEGPFFGGTSTSIQSTWYNAGKRLHRMQLSLEEGHAEFLALVSACDILIEDWRPGSPRFDPGELRTANPSLAHVSVTPMGADGPLAHWRVNDLVANVLSGAASVTGSASTPPISGYGNQSHHTVGLYAAICALAAHRAARLSGEYQHVDLSAHEALVSCTEQVLMEWFFPNGAWKTQIARRQGSLHWSNAYEVYPGADGHGVMVTAALRFVDVLLPWLKEDGAAQDLDNPEKYPTFISMIQDLPYVMKVMREWVATYDGETLFYEGQKRHQPFGVVWNIEEVVTRSPQIEARGYLQPVDVPGFGEVWFPGRFLRTSADGPHPLPGKSVDAVDWQPRERRPGATPGTSSRPLEGMRIMDFTHVLAGPFGTRVLGDLGADVLKIGTAVRGGGANNSEHPYYTCWNRNKRSVSVNMGSAEGRAVALKLAAKCDVIMENFSAGVLRRWGLDRDSLRETNPGISVISMGGMGQDGPWKDFVTFAPTIHALTGLTYLTNPSGEHFLGYGFSLTDHLSGLAGAFAAIQAVEHRDRTGEGLTIDLSQYELGLGLMGPALLDYLSNGANPEPVGNRHPHGAWAPHGIYRAAGEDEWVAVAVQGDVDWQRLGNLTGIDDTRFETHAGRLQFQDDLDAAIECWTKSRDRFQIANECQALGIAAGAVQNARDLAEGDPQLAARKFFGTAQAAPWGEYGLDRFPARFNGARPAIYEGVRQGGADTFDVLTEVIGLSDEEIAELMANGALT